jgi:PAS domain S-box-containing protein
MKARFGLQANLKYLVGMAILLAAILIFVAVIVLVGYRSSILRVMKKDGTALIETLIQSSQNALQASTIIDEAIGQRLLENARLIDNIANLNDNLLGQIALTNNLSGIDLVDAEGKIIASSHRHRQLPFEIEEIEPILKGESSELAFGIGEPTIVRYAVALKRGKNPGIIIIYADASGIKEFKRETGIGYLIQRIGREPRIEYLLLQDEEGILFATKNVTEMTKIKDDPFIQDAIANNTLESRRTNFYGHQILELVKPFVFNGEPHGVFRVGLSLDEYRQVLSTTRRQIFILVAILFLLGIIAAGLIITSQGYRLMKQSYEKVTTSTKELLEHLPLGVVTSDNTYRLTAINDYAAKLFGMPSHKAIGADYKELFTQDECLLSKAISEGKVLRNAEYPYKHTDGKDLTLSVIAAPVFNNRGESQGGISIIEDITERRALEEQIQRTQQLEVLGNLAASVAHEIRNPLNAISLTVQRLEKEYAPKEGKAEYLEFLGLIKNEIRRLDNRIKEFLSLAAPLRLSFTEVDLNQILDEVLTLVTPTADATKVKIVRNFSKIPSVSIDIDSIKRAFLNLFKNGIEAMPNGGELSVQTIGSDDAVEVIIKDTGKGIAKENLSKIFRPYYSEKKEGTGIGLAIVHQIIAAHKGSIEVDSELSKGTTFKVKLPLHRRAS